METTHTVPDVAHSHKEPQLRPNVPFFNDDETSSVSQSDTSTDSSGKDSFFDKAGGWFFRKAQSSHMNEEIPTMAKLKTFMALWSNFKPSTDDDCLPYNEILTTNDPFMTLSPFRVRCDFAYSNFISFLVNSVRREMADMFVYVLPSVIERSVDGLTQEECNDFRAWWNGFAEYVFTVLMTVSKTIEKMHKDTLDTVQKLDLNKRRDVMREYKRCLERLQVTSEIPMRAMQKKVQKLVDGRSARDVLAVDEMWCCLSSFILQTLDDSLSIARSVETKAQLTMPSGLQEKLLQGMLNPPRHVRSVDTADFVSNIVISLTRWMRDDAIVMQFVTRFLKNRIAREMDAHVVTYVQRRQICMFQFVRKPNGEPRKVGHQPSKVKFEFS